MVAVHEQRRELAVVQLLQPLLLALIAVLDTAEVPADNKVVISSETSAHGKVVCREFFNVDISVNIACYKNHLKSSFHKLKLNNIN